MIASYVSYLDLVASNDGKNFAIPPGIVTRCNYARPYHFWLSAYLARELTREGHSPKAAFLSLHHLNSLYESLGEVATSTTEKYVIADESFIRRKPKRRSVQ